MKYFQKIKKHFWSFFSIIAVAILIFAHLFLLSFKPDTNIAALVPKEASFFLEVEKNAMPQVFLEKLFGGRGTQLFQEGGAVFYFKEKPVFVFKKGGYETLKSENYLGYNLENNFTGEDYWSFQKNGLYLEGDREALKNVINYYVNYSEDLRDNPTWRELKENLPSSSARAYFLKPNPEFEVFTKGTGLSFNMNQDGFELQALTLLERDIVATFNYGQVREKWDKDLIQYADKNSCLVLGGENLTLQIHWVRLLLNQYSDFAEKWLEGLFWYGQGSGIPLQKIIAEAKEEALLTWDGEDWEVLLEDEVVSSLDVSKDLEIISDFAKMSKNARFGAVFFASNCKMEGKIISDFLGFEVEKIIFDEQVYDDRIFTNLKIER